jgi:hypothetical protein
MLCPLRAYDTEKLLLQSTWALFVQVIKDFLFRTEEQAHPQGETLDFLNRIYPSLLPNNKNATVPQQRGRGDEVEKALRVVHKWPKPFV